MSSIKMFLRWFLTVCPDEGQSQVLLSELYEDYLSWQVYVTEVKHLPANIISFKAALKALGPITCVNKEPGGIGSSIIFEKDELLKILPEVYWTKD